MKTININGKDYSIEDLTKILDKAKEENLFDIVYKYHNTTEKDFNELYKNMPSHIKAYEKECMLVSYYNKGWIPDFKNKKESKWYAWFFMDEFRLCDCDFYFSDSFVPARLFWKNESDLREAVKLYGDVFKENREY